MITHGASFHLQLLHLLLSYSLQYWLLLVQEGYIKDKDDDGTSLVDAIAFFYAKDEEPRPQPVDKGE